MKLINGEGPKNAKIVIIGEAPGSMEELKGRPFVGRSGYILMDVLMKNGLSRDQVYLTNLIKEYLPDNRDPNSFEIEKYKPLLEEELELIKPEVVITLGRIPASVFLGKSFKITRDRGTMCPNIRGFWLMPTFHPSFLGRTPESKSQFERDISYVIKKVYG
jgi:uracil-DNA glycosylase family 4